MNVRGSEDILIVEEFTPAVTIGQSLPYLSERRSDHQALGSVMLALIPECPDSPIAPYSTTDPRLLVAHLCKSLLASQAWLTGIVSRLALAQPRQWA